MTFQNTTRNKLIVGAIFIIAVLILKIFFSQDKTEVNTTWYLIMLVISPVSLFVICLFFFDDLKFSTQKEKELSIENKIQRWSNFFGAPILGKPGRPSDDRIKLAYDLISEELKELWSELFYIDAGGTLQIKDFISLNKVADALGDILWVTYRGFMEFGLAPEEVINVIYLSNMSKLCATEEEAQMTVAHYAKTNITADYKMIKEKFVVFNKESGKILKSCLWTEPEFNYGNI